MRTGERIKERRTALGISIDELAPKIGKNRATLYRYENGDIENMPIAVVSDLARALQTSPGYLLGLTDDPTPEEEAPTAGPTDSEIRAAFFNGADPTITPAEQEEMWDEVRDYINYKIQQRRKGNT